MRGLLRFAAVNVLELTKGPAVVAETFLFSPDFSNYFQYVKKPKMYSLRYDEKELISGLFKESAGRNAFISKSQALDTPHQNGG